MSNAVVRYDAKRRTWIVEQDFIVNSCGVTIRIPAKFESDLASIPRVFWNLEAPFELSVEAPLVHDFGYRHGFLELVRGPNVIEAKAFSRAEIDRFFLDVMKQQGVGMFKRRFAYVAVRLFGRRAWKPRS